ncbi:MULTISPECIES: type II toxin-antitoxin system toxin DNA ADP-ribosyl transferase DarT [Burkholderia]|uniref:type II toxin-antitoxin system toxin DNA ADP-ribosyl transferase DarT n=1 Tax=Burkholderia TaxID=32008 RepID=UPI001641068B|nr:MULTISPECIES: DUF4433 domain-containing protein [Burkholderia]UJH73330.1 DUF4433 domain-containing protein [Burkholderia cenocepacia]
MAIPNPVRIFHITAIANFAQVCATAHLWPKNVLARAGMSYSNIAYQRIQRMRAEKVVTKGPGGLLHDYVPFYFAPRSPMLSTINQGNVDGCQWRQADIIHLESTVPNVVGAQLRYVFYDRNASLAIARPYDDLGDIDKVSWDLITEEPCMDGYCKYWFNRNDPARYVDRMERRQAEFLVHERFPLALVTRIGVANEQARTVVANIIAGAGLAIPTTVQPNWYF